MSFTILCWGQGRELKASLLPLRWVNLLSAFPPLEVACKEEERDGTEGSGGHKLLGACADTHLGDR